MKQDRRNGGFGQGKSRSDATQIQYALKMLLEPDSVAELRVPSARRGTVSGYFDDFDCLAKTAAAYSGAAAGVYVTINPVNPTLLARAKNRMIAYPKHITGDVDIVRRRWIPVDLDSLRPSGVSSTDEEYQTALERARELHAFLVSLGFPESSMGLADSGSRAHARLLQPFVVPVIKQGLISISVTLHLLSSL